MTSPSLPIHVISVPKGSSGGRRAVRQTSTIITIIVNDKTHTNESCISDWTYGDVSDMKSSITW
jgi:hypothetical protein